MNIGNIFWNEARQFQIFNRTSSYSNSLFSLVLLLINYYGSFKYALVIPWEIAGDTLAFDSSYPPWIAWHMFKSVFFTHNCFMLLLIKVDYIFCNRMVLYIFFIPIRFTLSVWHQQLKKNYTYPNYLKASKTIASPLKNVCGEGW